MANTYDIGAVVRLTAEYEQSGSALDPSTVSLQVREPNGQTTTYTYGSGDDVIVRTATGTFRADFSPTMAGTHWYRWSSTGTGAGAGEQRFDVRDMQVQK